MAARKSARQTRAARTTLAHHFILVLPHRAPATFARRGAKHTCGPLSVSSSIWLATSTLSQMLTFDMALLSPSMQGSLASADSRPLMGVGAETRDEPQLDARSAYAATSRGPILPSGLYRVLELVGADGLIALFGSM
jgi:hypothetical protein